jgi:hypothetical protein
VGTGPVGIKVTHLPTGIVAVCQHMRSQHYNRAVCLSGIERMLAEAGWQPQASAEDVRLVDGFMFMCQDAKTNAAWRRIRAPLGVGQ